MSKYVIALLVFSIIIFGGVWQAEALANSTLPDSGGLLEDGLLQDAPATATPIPPPSPTPSPTPLLLPTVSNTATVTSTGTAAAAAPQAQLEVLSPALNVREGPGTDFSAIAVAFLGDVFAVETLNSSGTWAQITTGSGQTGWVSAIPPYAQMRNGSTAIIQQQQQSVAPLQLQPESAEALLQRTLPPSARALSAPPQPVSGQLIFTNGSGGTLYAINADGSNLRPITGGVIDPVVSHDAQQVAFTRWDGAELGALFVINIDGTGERAILGDILQPKSPAWSPDGQEIVIAFQQGGVRDPQRQCRKFNPGEQVRIPDRAEILWSGTQPDGRLRVCFVQKEDLQWILRQINVATGQFEDLASDEYAYNPAWDPQQPWRVIYSARDGLRQMDMNYGNEWALTEDLRDNGAVFSPDGQRLAITYKQHDHWEVYTYDLATGARQRLTKPPILADPQYNSAAPAWSPDGQHLAFLTDRSGSWEIWVMNADGSNQRPLFPPEVQAQWGLAYHGVNERMLNWIE